MRLIIASGRMGLTTHGHTTRRPALPSKVAPTVCAGELKAAIPATGSSIRSRSIAKRELPGMRPRRSTSTRVGVTPYNAASHSEIKMSRQGYSLR